jgi:hypothetical protein
VVRLNQSKVSKVFFTQRKKNQKKTLKNFSIFFLFFFSFFSFFSVGWQKHTQMVFYRRAGGSAFHGAGGFPRWRIPNNNNNTANAGWNAGRHQQRRTVFAIPRIGAMLIRLPLTMAGLGAGATGFAYYKVNGMLLLLFLSTHDLLACLGS